jgi:hypothetical protein
MSVPPTTVTTLQEPKALSGSALPSERSEPLALAVQRERTHRIHHVFPVYHPPRVG